jgi:hypothetical protein
VLLYYDGAIEAAEGLDSRLPGPALTSLETWARAAGLAATNDGGLLTPRDRAAR